MGVCDKIYDLVFCYEYVRESVDENGAIDVSHLKERIRNTFTNPTEFEVEEQCKYCINTYNYLMALFTESELFELWDKLMEG